MCWHQVVNLRYSFHHVQLYLVCLYRILLKTKSKIMKALKNITAMTILALTAILCLAQFSNKKPASICKKCQQEAAAPVADAENFNLINLLTLKFM